MCEPMTIMAGVGAGMAVLGSVSGQKDQADLIGEQRKAQARNATEMIKQFNFRDQQLNDQDRAERDKVIGELTNANIAAIRNQSMLSAAFGETGLEGRSIDAVMRDVEGASAQQRAGIQDKYLQTRRGIQSQSEQNAAQTQAGINGIPKINAPSGVSQALGTINAGMQGAQAGISMASSYKTLMNPAAAKGGK